MNRPSGERRQDEPREKLWLAILLAAVLVRVLTLAAYPLHDTTEARYAEVARLMLVSENWITPQIADGVPFWGKPPMSFWLTASSFKLFGLNEFAARLPSLLLLLLTGWLVLLLATKVYARQAGLAATTILATSAIGFVAAGAVMTDAALLFATTLALVAFWMATVEKDRRWQYVFFVALGLGLLAKGPVALILAGFPIAVWLFLSRKDVLATRCMPWVNGSLVMLAVAAPWYILAELETPGFLEYFLVGEHWLRFVESGWQGDLYGSAHARPRGAIWLFWIAAAAPWSLIAIYWLSRTWIAERRFPALTAFQRYAVLWCVTPMLFFTLSGNILPAYVLPGIPGLALLLAKPLDRASPRSLQVGWAVPAVFAATVFALSLGLIAGKTQKQLVDFHAANAPSGMLVYYPKKPFSADFYSAGTAHVARDADDLLDILNSPFPASVAIRGGGLQTAFPALDSCLRFNAEFGAYSLYTKTSTACLTSSLQ